MMREDYRNLRIGLIGLGLETYWSQFAGLKERLEAYINDVAKMTGAPGRLTVNLGLIDSSAKAREAGVTLHLNPGIRLVCFQPVAKT